MYIIKKVLTSPAVIGVVIVAFIYLSLVFYILNYKKKKPLSMRIKKTKKNANHSKDSEQKIDSEDSPEEEYEE